MKQFIQSPLPFQGQKRNFVKKLKEVLPNYSPDSIYVDLFGGSGLLSHTVKEKYPNAHVVFNDFDNFSQRLNSIPITNQILAEIRPIVEIYNKNQSIATIDKNAIIAIIEKYIKKYGYVDLITLSSNLLFSMNYALTIEQLKKETFYKKVRLSDYNADGYLDGVEIVSQDYKILFEAYRTYTNAVFLVDPPYLSTDTSTYSKESYWKLSDYLDVLTTITGDNYIYFTSNKSHIIELCDWIENRTFDANPFKNANMDTVNVSTTHNAKYTDIMVYKYI